MKWIRIWTEETLKGTTFRELSVEERGVWFSLLVMAGASLTPGIVEMRKGVGYPIEHLALYLNCPTAVLKKAIQRLEKVGKIKMLKDGRVKIVNWEKYQTRYQRYYREDTRVNGGMPKKEKKEEQKTEEKKEVMRFSPDDFLNLYHKLCPNLPKVREFSEGRRRKVKVRLGEHSDSEYWKKVFLIARKSGFTSGGKVWRPDFDFIITNDSNYIKILEGRYLSRKEEPEPPPPRAPKIELKDALSPEENRQRAAELLKKLAEKKEAQ